MVPRTMRRYWGELSTPLYGPCSCMAHYLRMRNTRRSPNLWRQASIASANSAQASAKSG